MLVINKLDLFPAERFKYRNVSSIRLKMLSSSMLLDLKMIERMFIRFQRIYGPSRDVCVVIYVHLNKVTGRVELENGSSKLSPSLQTNQ